MNTVDWSQLSMVPIYKFEYDCQFIGIDDVKSYVVMGIIKPSEFKEITGQDYVAN